MAAPAALGISKLFYPETERSLTTMDNIELPKVGNGRVRVMTRVTSRVDGKSQVRQCLGFCSADTTRTKNQLYKKPNIAKLETSYQFWS